MNFLKTNFLAILFCVLIGIFAFLPFNQILLYKLVCLFFLFGIFFYWIRSDISLSKIMFIAFISRFILVFSFPNLSQDLYRLIWDGHVLNDFKNPYFQLPNLLINDAHFKNFASIYQNLSAQASASVFMPFNQFLSFISVAINTKSVFSEMIVFKIVIFLIEVATVLMMITLLDEFQKDKTLVKWYALNPLVIVLFVGNVQFMGVFLFFSLIAFWMYMNGKFLGAVFPLVLGFSVNFMAILFLPFYLIKLKWYKGLLFLLLFIILSMLFWSPFLWKVGIDEILLFYFHVFKSLIMNLNTAMLFICLIPFLIFLNTNRFIFLNIIVIGCSVFLCFWENNAYNLYSFFVYLSLHLYAVFYLILNIKNKKESLENSISEMNS